MQKGDFRNSNVDEEREEARKDSERFKNLLGSGLSEFVALQMMKKDIKDQMERERKHHSPMTEAQGERIIELLEKLTYPQATSITSQLRRGPNNELKRDRIGGR